jgi:putative hydrolase of the HAD superfamily
LAFDRVIVFDLDDTLYLERDYVESGLAAVGRWAETQLAIAGLSDAMIAYFRAGRRETIFNVCLNEMGIEPTSAIVSRMLAVYRQHAPRIDLAEDAVRFLAHPEVRTAFAIITDGFLDAQRRKLRALQVYTRGVSFGVCTDRWGRHAWKPNPMAFLHVQNRFGLEPKYFTYIADNPAKDFHAPNAIGWHTVQLARPGGLPHIRRPSDVRADRLITTLDAL